MIAMRRRKYPYFILYTLLILYIPYYCFYNVEVIRMQVCFTHVKGIHFSA